jgi:hypothetical protein
MLTKPEIVIEFRANGSSYTAHATMTMDGVADDIETLREEFMDDLRWRLRGTGYKVTLVIPEMSEDSDESS